MLRTRLCDLLGIDLPIVQAGMAGATNAELVAAVSEAGALGVLGAARIAPDALREAIRAIRGRTQKPFGVNLLLAPPEPGARDVAAAQRALDTVRAEMGLPPGKTELSLPASPLAAQLDVIFEERVPVFSVGLGDPTPIVERAHAAGARVMAMVTTVAEAVRVARGGADVVVAQGGEAGGHRSTFQLGAGGEAALVGTMALVPQVADAVDVPVVAAGGIADGRGLLAALALDASGVQIGTRFLAARECPVFGAWKRRVAEASEADTVVTRAFTGRPARVLRNRLLEQLAGAQPLPWPLQAVAAEDVYTAAAQRDDAEHAPLYAGQAAHLARRDQSAAEIVREIAAEAEAILTTLRV